MTDSFALLRVQIGPEGVNGTPLNWLAMDASGQPQARGCSPLTALPGAAALELVLPARHVAAHLIELPASSAKHETALIRQALEDRLLGESGKNLIVSGARHGKQIEVWVTARDWLEPLLAKLATAGRAADNITPEQALLQPGSCAETPSGWIFQREAGIYGLLPSQELLLALGGSGLQHTPELLAAPLAKRVNLLAGLPGLRRASAGFSVNALKPAVYLLIAAGLLYLLSQVLVWRQLAAQEAGLRQAIRQNFAAANPGVPIVDPILQWRQRQGKPGQQGGDALDQLARFAALTQLSIQPRRIEAEDGRLKLTLTTSDAAQLKPVLQSKGISFDSQTTDKGLEQLSITPAKAQP